MFYSFKVKQFLTVKKEVEWEFCFTIQIWLVTKLKLLIESFLGNSRSQHVKIFQHCLVLSMQKTGPV